MTDEKLRELERRFKETGLPEDEAAWLKERVRAGDLTQDRLALAVHCGQQVAFELTGTGWQEPPALETWITALYDHCFDQAGHEWAQLTCVRVAYWAVAAIEAQSSDPPLPEEHAQLVTEGLEAIQHFLVRPRLMTRSRVGDFVGRFHELREAGRIPVHGPKDPLRDVIEVAEACLGDIRPLVLDPLHRLSFALGGVPNGVSQRLRQWALA